MKRDPALYVGDMLQNMNKAIEFIGEMDYSVFIKDDKTAYAVFRCLEIIGEAAKNVPQDVRENYSDIPWRSMAGMRDKMIHAYFGIDYEVVWLTLKKKIPELQVQLTSVLEDIRKRDTA